MFKKYLVTGATGFLGRTVISVLVQNSKEVYALVLPQDRHCAEFPAGIHVKSGDVRDKSSLEQFFSGADADTCVIHCAGIVSVASHPSKLLYDVNVNGTENILDLCKQHNIGKLIYVSSVHAIPEKPMGTEISETTVFSPELVKGDYAKSKALATSMVFSAAESGLNASVVFPTGIIGPGDTTGGSITHLLLSFLAKKLPIAVKGGYDFVDVRDVANGILNCAQYGEPGHGYILSGHYTTIREILETIKQTFLLKHRVVYLPIVFAKLVAPVYEKICLCRNKPLFFTPYAVQVLNSNGMFCHKAASQTFDYSPRKLYCTLKDTVLWLQKNESDALPNSFAALNKNP